jgi:23S rRNA A2030 N6-methylase RlmJ
MLVVNPPFGFEEEAGAILDWLWRMLAMGGAGGKRVRWLVPE